MLFLVNLCFLLVRPSAEAASFSTFRSGNWNDPRTWTNNGNGGIPGPLDDVSISGKDVLVLNVPLAQCASLTLKSASGSSTLIFSGSNKLVVSGNVVITSPTQDGDSKTIEVGSGTLEAANLTLTGSNGLRIGKLMLSNGLVKIRNNITFVGGTNAMIDISGTGILRVGGILGANGTLNPGTSSTVIFDGLAPQTMPSTLSYAHVTIENPTTVTLDGAVTQGKLTGNLKVTAGTLENGGFAIAGTGGGVIQVLDDAALGLGGTSTFPTGFANIILGPISKVMYKGANQRVAALTYGKLAISKTGTGVIKTLEGDASVITALEFNNVKLNASNHVFTVGPSAIITGPTSAAYVVTGGTGKLLIRNVGTGGRSGEVLFPVGATSSSYTPAYITNQGPANSFSVHVTDGVKDRYGNLIAAHVVNKTWDVTNETTNNTDNVKLRLQWTADDETAGFNRATCSISHYDAQAGTWNRIGLPGTASGLNPYAAIGQGIVAFSPFAVGDLDSPLPVDMMYFNATKVDQGALLTWETATEKNNQGFEVQVSADGRNFETAGSVNTLNGNSSSNQKYKYLDKQQGRTGTWYYRLKQTDLDGKASFFGPKAVSFSKQEEGVKVFPNPFKEQFSLQLKALDEEPVELTLTDMCGREVYRELRPVVNGSNDLQVNLKGDYPAGLYLLTAKTKQNVFSSRLLKQ
ncbi:T9SS type A sorting domain-containing protein [Adhaeribacter soli]|uniref:T9SS type A sorting domain-containing protein n=1 Tax=Adhaeribacter soli TaxID=2607655 RepID=UPI00177CA1D9|nr:T9SS type A sorting domain-containing protein [Adhaeribacter soli]